MKRNIEVVLKGKGRLDVETKVLESFGLEIKYAISDLTDVGSRKSNYSKSFKLLGTPNNNKLFEHTYDINFYDNTFDMNKRQPCYIMVNKNTVIDGYLKLRKIDRQFISGKYQIVYNVNVYDEIADVFSELGEKNLRDLDFSEGFAFMGSVYDKGDHTYDVDTIVASQARDKSISNVYDYAITNWNYNGVNSGNNFPNNGDLSLSQFYPSVYLKPIIDKMFSDIGYTYESDFFEGNIFDGIFTDMATIYNGAKMYTDNSRYYRMHNYWGETYTNDFYYATTPEDVFEPEPEDFKEYVINNTKVYQTDTAQLGNSIKINGDATYNFRFTVRTTGNSEYNDLTSTFILKNNFDEVIYSRTLWDFRTFLYGDTQEVTIDLSKGDIITPYISVGINRVGSAGVYEGATVELEYFTMRAFIMHADVEDMEGEEVPLNEFLPNITQVDFLKSIITQFNLYVQPDKLNNKKLLIEPRSVFYGKGEKLDWTQKVDDNVSSIEPMNKKINRYYNFEMGEVDSLATTTYYNTWESNYGDYEIDLENNDITGTDTIKSLFGGYDYKYYSTTDDYVFIPNYVADLEDGIWTKKRELPPMIGFINNHQTAPYSWKFAGDSATPLRWNTINHIERFANGAAKYDINFETKQGTSTYINSYTNFWKAGMDNLFNNNNRIVTYYVELSLEDIIDLDFKNTVIIKGELYYIENIVTDISSESASKLQLIKAYDYVSYQAPVRYPLLWGKFDTGSIIGSGAGRPLINDTLLDDANIDYSKPLDTYFAISPNAALTDYLWFATPNTTVYNKKNSWATSEYNKGSIGGGINLGENLFPEVVEYDYNGVSYNVYLANYQTYIDTIKLDYANTTTITSGDDTDDGDGYPVDDFEFSFN